MSNAPLFLCCPAPSTLPETINVDVPENLRRMTYDGKEENGQLRFNLGTDWLKSATVNRRLTFSLDDEGLERAILVGIMQYGDIEIYLFIS